MEEESCTIDSNGRVSCCDNGRSNMFNYRRINCKIFCVVIAVYAFVKKDNNKISVGTGDHCKCM